MYCENKYIYFFVTPHIATFSSSDDPALSPKHYIPIQKNCILNYVRKEKYFCRKLRLSLAVHKYVCNYRLRMATASDVVKQATRRAGDVLYRATVDESYVELSSPQEERRAVKQTFIVAKRRYYNFREVNQLPSRNT